MNAPLISTSVLALAWFAVVNVMGSFAAWGAANLVLRTRAGRRADVLLAIRLLPAALSMFFVAALFIPAHWRFEPADAQESFGVVLYALSAMGAALLLRSAVRAAAVARAGWRLRAFTELLPVDSGSRVYQVEGLGGVSLAGVFRTRILVGAAVRGSLTAAELSVALAHERAHRRAFDNLKRFVMFCAPDLFGDSAASRKVEAAWRATAEWLADARAVDGDGTRAVHLASALVKVSRLASGPSPIVTSPAWSALNDPPLLELRVRRLVEEDAPVAAPRNPAYRAAGVTIAAALLLSSSTLVGPVVHQLTEAFVHILP